MRCFFFFGDIRTGACADGYDAYSVLCRRLRETDSAAKDDLLMPLAGYSDVQYHLEAIENIGMEISTRDRNNMLRKKCAS